MASQRSAPITLTDAAIAHAKGLLARRDPQPAGLRLSVDTRGCSGMSYRIDYVEEVPSGDEIVEADGVRIFVDPMAVMFVLGTEVDYREDTFTSGFVFSNPLEKGRCGCGESFHI
jgi:iron-sulfur cluster assembly accessory protein